VRRRVSGGGRLLIGVVAALAILYLGDDLSVRYRMARRSAADPIEEITFYYATTLKNGWVEVFYGQPRRTVCAHALFPHLGHGPCWFVGRSPVRKVVAPPAPGTAVA
jgi:hypothetical protein